MDVVSCALERCPFLGQLAREHGEQFTRNIATNPFKPAGGRAPLLAEEVDFAHSFKLFHGPRGIVPLTDKPEARVEEIVAEESAPCTSAAARQGGPRPLPLASMSFGFFGTPDFGRFFRRHNGSGGSNDRPAPKRHGANPGKPQPKPQRPPQPPATSSTASARLSGPLNGPASGPLGGAGASAGGAAGAAAGGSSCPMRTFLGPLSGLVFNSYGKLTCPEPIVRMRAALAATVPVRELRPRALPIKLLAVGATAAVLNIPCGAWREHTSKFSFEWFLAVHATIPFIAMLRKAVIMPKYAIVMTIASAVVGQAMGARMERQRLAALRAAQTGPTSLAHEGELASMMMAAPEAPALLPARSVRPAAGGGKRVSEVAIVAAADSEAGGATGGRLRRRRAVPARICSSQVPLALPLLAASVPCGSA